LFTGFLSSQINMKASILSLVFVACASAAPPLSLHVVHEKRDTQLEKWSRRRLELNQDAIIPISIGLT
jgi:tripeptidyl-peptidase-1